MNKLKQHAKLIKLQAKAQKCETREEAQKLIRKSEMTQAKLSFSII